MIQFIKRIFGIAETDLSAILSSFRKVLADLDAHIAYHTEAAQEQNAVAEAAVAARNLHDANAATARKVFANISNLVEAS